MPRRTNRSYVYSHLMRWEPLDVKGSTGFAWIKTLAIDEETGARTALVKYDPGFTAPESVSNWPVDMYVLEGSMESGDRKYQKDTYHYRPAGARVGPVSSPEGITRFLITADRKDLGEKKEVFQQDMKQVPWGPTAIDPTGKERAGKLLREDTVGNYTLLVSTNLLPGLRNQVGQAHIHNHTEEAFVMEGEFEDWLGDIDGHFRWMPGLYVERPPDESLHGDVLVLKTPTYILVRRGVTGDHTKFYEKRKEHTSEPVSLTGVKFAE